MIQAETARQLLYQYMAYNSNGEIVKGKLSAVNEGAVNELLNYAGYRVINIKQLAPSLSLGTLSFNTPRVKPTEMMLFFRQMALLLESGLDIITSLELLQSQGSSRTLNRVLGEVIVDLRSGNRLSAALSKHPKLFSPICCHSLRVGEETGNIEKMLRHIADYVEKEVVTAKSLKSALMMPLITAGVAIGVVAILVNVVLPAFSGLYSSLGAELPLITRMTIAAADWLKSNGVYLIGGILAAGGVAFAYTKTPKGKYKWSQLMLRLPLLGRVNHLNELARCCRSISLLYKAGLPLPEIIPLTASTSGNKIIAEALVNVHQDMLKGEGLSKPMSKNNLFLPLMVRMVMVGEETGNLDSTMLTAAQNYETEAEDKTRSLIGLIQPVMTLVIGGVVGVIALSLVSAMYSIYGQSF